MQVDFGQDVISSDGKKVGTVAGLVLDAETKEIRRLVIGANIFGDDRLADYSVIQTADAAGLKLALTAAAAEHLPIFVKQDHVIAQPADPLAVVMPATGMGGPFFYESATAGTDYPGGDSFFAAAPIDPPVLEVRSNLSESEVMIRKGSDVVGSDGDKVGTVDEVIADASGDIAAFVVRAGFLFKHDVRVPLAWVADVDDNRIVLNLTGAEAERQGRA